MQNEYGLTTTKEMLNLKYDAVVLGVAHKEFSSMDFDTLRNQNRVLYDVKGVLGADLDDRL